MICSKCQKKLPDGSLYCNWCGACQQKKPKNSKKRGNGQGSVYWVPDRKVWRAEKVLGYYTDENGKRQKKVITRQFKKRSDAINILPSLSVEVERVKDANLHDLFEAYQKTLDYQNLSSSQRDKLGYAWKRWSKYEWTGISQLTVADIEDHIETSVSTYYPARDMKVCLSHLYKLAIKKEIVKYNKTDYVDIPYDTPTAKRECWTKEEVDAFWKDYEMHPFAAYILIMCYAGLRYGELASISLQNIFLDKDYMVGGNKTEAGINREIPIHSRIKPLIEKIILARKNKLLEMNEDNFYTFYWATIQRTGVRELPPHTCRHYFFSMMTAAGVQGGLIAEVGGHANYLTTLKNYVRIPLEDKLKAVNSI